MNRTPSKIFPLVATVLLVSGCIGPIKDIDYQPSSTITIRENLKTLRFTLYSGDRPVKPKSGKKYYWYGTNRIQSTVGDYTGRVLDGTYMAFDDSGSLIEKGIFEKGLKEGRWVTWYRDGEVRYCMKYHRGVAGDTIRSNWIKKLFSGKSDTVRVKAVDKKKEKSKKKKKHEKEKAGT